MFTEQSFSPKPFGNITEKTQEEHKKLYAGYVKNANSVLEKITRYQRDDTMAYERGELYRHFSFEFNGMRNHECYFALLSSGPNDEAPTLHAAIEKQWGSLDAYKEAHTALAATTRGIGWAMLSFDPHSGMLLLHWVDEQHLGQLQHTTPIIAIDLWEHSYVADYQPSGKKQYITDFMQAISWSAAEAHYTSATTAH